MEQMLDASEFRLSHKFKPETHYDIKNSGKIRSILIGNSLNFHKRFERLNSKRYLKLLRTVIL